jgi:hypothetical protein
MGDHGPPGPTEEDIVKYMLLIYSPVGAYDALDAEARGQLHRDYGDYTQAIIESGEFVNGDPLQGVETATTVRVRGGQRTLTDGPFAETKEALAGFYTVDVKDLDRAVELAERLPGAVRERDSIEIRPVMPFM